MSNVNYQVQELRGDTWVWFSDFETFSGAKEMKLVYQKYYPQKKFRIERQEFRKEGDAS